MILTIRKDHFTNWHRGLIFSLTFLCVNLFTSEAFVAPIFPHRSNDLSPLRFSPFDDESPEQLHARMVMVRKIQNSYYSPPVNAVTENQFPLALGASILENLPLYRVQRTELPGYQTVLKVQEFDAHMFLEIITGKSKPWYFGHMFLPGGAENLDNPQYLLHAGTYATLTGVLMQICDYQQMDDGTLILIVQALEKIKVSDVKRHFPYAIATVQVIPEEELLEDYCCRLSESLHDDEREGAAYAAYVAEALHIWQQFETRQVDINSSRIPGVDTIAIAPLSTYDSYAFDADESHDEVMPAAVNEYLKNYDVPSSTEVKNKISCKLDSEILELEQTLWIELDQMMKNLRRTKKSYLWKVAIPNQILGLLPMHPPKPWPEDFELISSLKKSRRVFGDGPQSRFVVVDDDRNDEAHASYPQLRRVNRLSFVIWFFLDIVEPSQNYMKQKILEMDSISERLSAAIDRFKEINEKMKNKSKEA